MLGHTGTRVRTQLEVGLKGLGHLSLHHSGNKFVPDWGGKLSQWYPKIQPNFLQSIILVLDHVGRTGWHLTFTDVGIARTTAVAIDMFSA